MNPVFWLFVVLVLIAVWFGLTVIFKPLGGFLARILNDTLETINEEDEEKENEE